MLLFVMETEFHQIELWLHEACHRLRHRSVNMRAIGENLSQRGASQQPPLRSCVTITLSLVIAIEKIGISVVENGIAGDMVAQQEGLEKPAGMG